jgi:broad specificity phosphatase PhoE
MGGLTAELVDEVILARHGESALSVVGRTNGDPATACALTDTGRKEARRLGELLASSRVDLCVVSEFQRARETADIAIAGRHDPSIVPRIVPVAEAMVALVIADHMIMSGRICSDHI